MIEVIIGISIISKLNTFESNTGYRSLFNLESMGSIIGVKYLLFV